MTRSRDDEIDLVSKYKPFKYFALPPTSLFLVFIRHCIEMCQNRITSFQSKAKLSLEGFFNFNLITICIFFRFYCYITLKQKTFIQQHSTKTQLPNIAYPIIIFDHSSLQSYFLLSHSNENLFVLLKAYAYQFFSSVLKFCPLLDLLKRSCWRIN